VVNGAGLHANCVPMNEARFHSVFAAYQAGLEAPPSPAERDKWQAAQQVGASQRLAVITGTCPHAFPILPDARTGSDGEVRPEMTRYALGGLEGGQAAGLKSGRSAV
jgi:hypothetical protein